MKAEMRLRCNEGRCYVTPGFEECEECEHFAQGAYDEPPECEEGLMEGFHDEFKAREKMNENIDEFLATDDIAMVKDAMVKQFGVDRKSVDSSLLSFVANIQSIAMSKIERSLESMVKDQIKEVIGDKFSSSIEGLFQKAITEQVVQFTGEDDAISSIQLHCSGKIKSFFASEYKSRDKRDSMIKSSMSKVIEKLSEQKVDAVIAEIKEDATNNFNSQMMKTMMRGMALEIQGNPKLLAMITDNP